MLFSNDSLFEDSNSVPNSVNLGVVPTMSPNYDNPDNGQPVTLVFPKEPDYIGTINNGINTATGVIETLGGLVGAVNNAIDQVKNPPPATTAVTTPNPTPNFIPVIIAVAAIAFFVLK